MRRDNAETLRRTAIIFRIGAGRVTLTAGGGFEAVSDAVDGVVERLVQAGIVPQWRNEFFAVAPRWGAPARISASIAAPCRSSARAPTACISMAIAATAGRLRLWIGRRAPDKKVAPDKLDNLVAGGISWEHGLVATLVKEAAEEAGIPPALIARAVPAGAVSYRMETPLGVRNDVLFVYDLEMPSEFVPRNTDGELVAFTLMDAAQVVERVRAGDDFKFNVNLVIIDFALRHGLVTPAEPDYLELVTGLHRPLA